MAFLMQKSLNSIASTLEVRLVCIKPSIWRNMQFRALLYFGVDYYCKIYCTRPNKILWFPAR